MSGIYALPEEILTSIFEQACEVTFRDTAREPLPFTVVRVCKDWNNIVLGSHSLWRFISVKSPKPTALKLAKTFLERSGNYDLDIFLHLAENGQHRILQTLLKEVHRWRSLVIRGTIPLYVKNAIFHLRATEVVPARLLHLEFIVDVDPNFVRYLPLPFDPRPPKLESIRLEGGLLVPTMTYLCNLTSLSTTRVGFWHGISAFKDIADACPGLRYLKIDLGDFPRTTATGAVFETDGSSGDGEEIIFPSLTSLEIVGNCYPDSCKTFIQRASMPELQKVKIVVHLGGEPIIHGEFLPLLADRHANIQEFHLSIISGVSSLPLSMVDCVGSLSAMKRIRVFVLEVPHDPCAAVILNKWLRRCLDGQGRDIFPSLEWLSVRAPFDKLGMMDQVALGDIIATIHSIRQSMGLPFEYLTQNIWEKYINRVFTG